MSVSGSQSGFPHFESNSPSILWLMKNNPYANVTSQFYPPFYYRRRAGAGKNNNNKALLRGGGAALTEQDISDHFGSVYQANRHHTIGGGLGSFFKSAYKVLKPVIFKGAHALADEGLKVGSDVLRDWKSNRAAAAAAEEDSTAGVPFNLKDTVRKNVRAAADRLSKRLPSILIGKGMKRKTGQKKSKKSPKKAKRVSQASKRRVSGGGSGKKKKQGTAKRKTRFIPLKLSSGSCQGRGATGGGRKRKKSGGKNKKKTSTSLGVLASPTFLSKKARRSLINASGPADIYSIK